MTYSYPLNDDNKHHHLFDTDEYSYYIVLLDGPGLYIDRIGPYPLPLPTGFIFVNDYLSDPEYLDHKEDYDRALEYFKKLSTLL